MLRKLMKYEFMAMGRIFLPLFGALIIISIVNSILGHFGLDVPERIGIVLSVLLMVGISVVTFIVIIQRFWTNLLSSEGYLMMTLPVSTDKIILSKLFTSSIWEVVSSVVLVIAILFITVGRVDYTEMIEGIRIAFRMIPFSSFQVVSLIMQFLAMLTLGAFSNILILYACMSLGMITTKYRWLVAVAAYIAITTVLQIVAVVASAVGFFTGLFELFERFLMSFTTFGTIHVIALIVNLIMAAFCVAFYFITRYMLKSRLNLQ